MARARKLQDPGDVRQRRDSEVVIRAPALEPPLTDRIMLEKELLIAVRANDLGRTRELLELGANPDALELGWSALSMAAARGYYGIAELLVDYHANLDLQDDEGRTALMLAIINRHEDIAEHLIKRGCDRFIRDYPRTAKGEEGRTEDARSLAQAYGMERIVELIDS